MNGRSTLLLVVVLVGCGALPAASSGPLALVQVDGGGDARNEGTLLITDRCTFLERDGQRELLVWPAGQTEWVAATREIRFTDPRDGAVLLRDGDAVVLGGGGSSLDEDGLDGDEWMSRMRWVAAPNPECLVDVRFIVSAASAP